MADLPPDLDRPVDHEQRMQVVRRAAQWHLGSEGWAGELIGAYLYPRAISEHLDDEGADPAPPPRYA